MKSLGKKLHLFGVLVVLAAGGIQTSAAGPVDEVAAIHAADDAWVKAVNAGDVDAMAALYEDHGVLLPPGAPVVRGRTAIREFFANMVAALGKDGIVFSLDANPAGGARGDLGWSSGTYTAKDKTGRVVETGKYLSVSRKKAGKWLYVRDTWNTDAPAAPEPAASPNK
jgi:uncharacterized protein (TIGR02246 family)